LSKFLLTPGSDKQINIVFIIAIIIIKLYARNMGEMVGPEFVPNVQFILKNPLFFSLPNFEFPQKYFPPEFSWQF